MSNTIAKKIYASTSGIELEKWATKLPRPLVFTNGCFDILHRGHVTYLETAANLGTLLLVGVNSDDSVKRQGKDPIKPVNPLEDRMTILGALQSVGGVVAFDEDTPLELIKKIRPDVLVKGGDWPVEQIVGGKEVERWGGSVHSIEFEFQRSTTDLIDRIRG